MKVILGPPEWTESPEFGGVEVPIVVAGCGCPEPHVAVAAMSPKNVFGRDLKGILDVLRLTLNLALRQALAECQDADQG